MHQRLWAHVGLIGVGGCGLAMLTSWQHKLPEGALCIGVDRPRRALASTPPFKPSFQLEGLKAKGSTVEYVGSVRREVRHCLAGILPELDESLRDFSRLVLLAGLGGVVGSWAGQELCRHLVEQGKQVTAMLVMPFGFERERTRVAEAALPGFDAAQARVLCFNDYLIRHAAASRLDEAYEEMNAQAFELLTLRD